ncbi:MAG: response regulator [Bacteroidetes bacterium]|jgi:DNA-binding LytR/AlgR family response regulator|nr:response regulator [Bacteroidota bacterium]
MKNSHYTFIVVEDVALQREHLTELLQARLDLHHQASFENAEEAYDYLSEQADNPPDLIFLDIEMPEASGFNFLEAIKHLRISPQVIITTAFAEYAVKGYEYDLSGYLLKPIEEEQLNRAIDKALKQRSPERQEDDHLMIKEKSRWVKLSYGEILYCEGANVDVRLVTLGGEYLTRDRIKNMEQRLPADRFLRIHDSFIINLEYIKSYASNFTFVELCPEPGAELQQLRIGPKYRDQFRERVSGE